MACRALSEKEKEERRLKRALEKAERQVAKLEGKAGRGAAKAAAGDTPAKDGAGGKGTPGAPARAGAGRVHLTDDVLVSLTAPAMAHALTNAFSPSHHMQPWRAEGCFWTMQRSPAVHGMKGDCRESGWTRGDAFSRV